MSVETERTARIKVGQKVVRVEKEFTRPSDTTAYNAGDVVSNSTSATTLIAFAQSASGLGGSGRILAVEIFTDKKSVVPQLDLILFTKSEATISVPVDNAPNTTVYANAPYRVGLFAVPALATGANTTDSTGSFGQLVGIDRPFQCASADSALYGVLVDNTGHTPASGQKFTVVLYIQQN